MIIKFCPRCADNPYTKDTKNTKCPVCGTSLQLASVSDAEVAGRPELPACEASSVSPGEKASPTGKYEENTYTEQDNETYAPPQSDTPRHSSASDLNSNSCHKRICVRGKISQYRTYSRESGNYRRLLPRKIYQAVRYGQRLEDFLHTFTLSETRSTDDAGNPVIQRYVVNVHGSTNFGANLVDNEEVRVVGKLTHDNILMATDISVINGSMTIPVKFQRSVKTIIISCIIGILLLLGIIGILESGGVNSIFSFTSAIGEFVKTIIAVYVILLILYLIVSFTRFGFMMRMMSRGQRKTSPLLTLFVISFIITVLLYNAI